MSTQHVSTRTQIGHKQVMTHISLPVPTAMTQTHPMNTAHTHWERFHETCVSLSLSPSVVIHHSFQTLDQQHPRVFYGILTHIHLFPLQSRGGTGSSLDYQECAFDKGQYREGLWAHTGGCVDRVTVKASAGAPQLSERLPRLVVPLTSWTENPLRRERPWACWLLNKVNLKYSQSFGAIKRAGVHACLHL